MRDIILDCKVLKIRRSAFLRYHGCIKLSKDLVCISQQITTCDTDTTQEPQNCSANCASCDKTPPHCQGSASHDQSRSSTTRRCLRQPTRCSAKSAISFPLSQGLLRGPDSWFQRSAGATPFTQTTTRIHSLSFCDMETDGGG